MSKQTSVSKLIYSLLPADVEGFDSLTCAAYFSMELMLSEALPIYSGGLGNVAIEQLKATSEMRSVAI